MIFYYKKNAFKQRAQSVHYNSKICVLLAIDYTFSF